MSPTPQPEPTDDDALDRLLWEYRMDVQRFTPGADLLIDKAKDKTKAAIKAHIQEAVVAARIDELNRLDVEDYQVMMSQEEWEERIAELKKEPSDG